ncbi:P-loop NTPase [Candidatus Woesearchaeota archaeon]|nr:P-loop NTPase [Candidatus Woesearchaeota archaeon]
MTKFIALISGKGGAGKTTATLNIGQSLVNLGKKTLLLDANLVTPNLALHLGLMNPHGTVNKFLRGEKNLKEIIYLHESGLSVIPASPSYAEFQKTNSQKIGKIFEQLENVADFVIVDSPSGLGVEVSEVLKNSDEAVIVVNPNHSSVMDALKTVELAKKHEVIIPGILLNMSNNGKYELKPKEIEHILGYPILADVKYHKKFRKACHQQQPLSYLYKYSSMARQFKQIASYLSLDKELKLK